jgi:hypothetical protein
MDKSTKTVVKIYQNDYEFLRLGEIVKEVKYFDTIYEMLVEKGQVVYKNYIIKYKPNNYKNKYQFIAYDSNETIIKSYNRAIDLANDYEVTESSVTYWFRNSNEYVTPEGDILVRSRRMYG